MGFYRGIFIEILTDILPLSNTVQPFFLPLAINLIFVPLIAVWVNTVLVMMKSINLNQSIPLFFLRF